MAVGEKRVAKLTWPMQLGQQGPPGVVLLDLHTKDVESDGGQGQLASVGLPCLRLCLKGPGLAKVSYQLGRGEPSTRIRAKTKKRPRTTYRPYHPPATPLPQLTVHTPKTQRSKDSGPAGAKADSTLRSSQAVPHPSTNRALCCLTSEVKRDPVHSTRYGRQRVLFEPADS